MSERDTEKDMDAAVQCLYIAVDKSVADDVFSRWIAYKADRRQRIAQLEAEVARLREELHGLTAIEYRVVKNPKQFFLCSEQEVWLNEMGRDGWELVSFSEKVIHGDLYRSEFYIFKRALP